uniref:Uncharacterized protein n=1 Tax=Lactuca sativa TaxID=4236 RepID=A0A9R1X2V6_LACSA|nr:hypothetical protein LSAT_V11C700363600 [Lactuca sativa]
MNEIKSLESRAYDYLIDRDPRYWSKDFSRQGMDCDAVENGVSESFNSSVLDARRKPLITMLEDIRCWAMHRLWMQKQNGLSWDLDICPSIRREIEDLKELQRLVTISLFIHWFILVPYVSGYKEFEVFSGNERGHVDAEADNSHAFHAFVSNSYTKAYFLSIYEYNIHPLSESFEWPHVEGLYTILPPLKRRDQAERELSGHTRHTVSRADIPLRCTICHQTGHNKATCPSKPTPAPSTTGPSQSTPASSTAGPSQSTPAPVKRTPVKKAPVKRIPIKKVPLNDAVG